MGKFITPKRLETFWATAVNKLTEGINGKKLSSNDLTDELKEKYDKAESNKIDSISVNGERQTIDTDKNVNIEFDAGTGIQDITQEEYEALSEEEKMRDTIYHITDTEDDNAIVIVMLGETSETAYAGDKGKALADKIGDTDISAIGDGTVTGAISALNIDNSRIELETVELKILGWTVPREMPLKNTVSGNTFIQKVGRVDLGSTGFYFHDTHKVFWKSIDGGKPTGNDYGSPNGYCSKYYVTSKNSDLYLPDKLMSVGNSFNGVKKYSIVIKDTAYTDITSFNNAMKGVYLYYELDTPVEIQIDGNEITTLDTISDAWDSAKTYEIGDYCIYYNSLWKTLVQHTNVIPVEGTYWTKVTIASEIKNRITYVKTIDKSVSIPANTWTVIDNSLNYFTGKYNFQLIFATSNWNNGNQTWGKLRAHTSTGNLEFCPDSDCDRIRINITTIK